MRLLPDVKPSLCCPCRNLEGRLPPTAAPLEQEAAPSTPTCCATPSRSSWAPCSEPTPALPARRAASSPARGTQRPGPRAWHPSSGPLLRPTGSAVGCIGRRWERGRRCRRGCSWRRRAAESAGLQESALWRPPGLLKAQVSKGLRSGIACQSSVWCLMLEAKLQSRGA